MIAALDYLNDLGKLWRDTDDEGRRRLAAATFVNLGVRGVPRAQLHEPKRPALARIVSVEASEDRRSCHKDHCGRGVETPTLSPLR